MKEKKTEKDATLRQYPWMLISSYHYTYSRDEETEADPVKHL